MKKLMTLVLILCLMSMTFMACSSGGGDSSDASGEGGKEFLSIGTGGVAGVYYPLGGAFSSIINNHLENYDSSVESTGGSVANIQLIGEQKADLGFVAASNLYEAVHKEGVFAEEEIDNLTGVLSLYPEAIQIVTLDPNIRSVADLKGKKVAVGAIGSGTETMAKTILDIYGLTYDDIEEDFLGFDEASTGLKDKTIDAGFIWAGVPTASILDLAAQHDLYLLNFEQSEIDRLLEISPYCVPMSIDSTIYSSLSSEITTIAIPAVLAGDSNLSEDFVYEFLAKTFENMDILKNAHARGADITLESSLQGLDDVPLHPGAEKYYKEQGLLN